MTQGDILAFLQGLKPELNAAGITKIGLFGSWANGTATPQSDIDIVIENGAKFRQMGGINCVIFIDDIARKIAAQFKKRVDICNSSTLLPEYKNALLKEAIYV